MKIIELYVPHGLRVYNGRELLDGEDALVRVQLSRAEIDLFHQALFYWVNNHPAYLGPTTQARLEEVNEMRELYEEFGELRMQLAKGGE